MITSGRIPSLVHRFSRPQQRFFSRPAWPHFCGLVTAMGVDIEHPAGLDVPSATLTGPAARAIDSLPLEGQRAQGHHKNKTVLRPAAADLRLPPIPQLKADLRRAVWNEAVKDIARVSHERTVIRRLEKLLAARNRSV